MTWAHAIKSLCNTLVTAFFAYEVGTEIHRSTGETQIIVKPEEPKHIDSDESDEIEKNIFYLLIIVIVAVLIFSIARMAFKPRRRVDNVRRVENIPLNQI